MQDKFVRNYFVKIQALTKYGFDDYIVQGLIKHDIMPKYIEHKGEYYVRKSDILKLINTFMKNGLKLYEVSEELSAKSASVAKLIEDDSAKFNSVLKETGDLKEALAIVNGSEDEAI